MTTPCWFRFPLYLYIARLVLLVLSLTISSPALAERLWCQVVHVTDGDSLTCLDQTKQQHKIRLSEIDAPERKQAFGQKSRQYLRDLVIHQHVEIHIDGRDRYKRILGTVYVGNHNINLRIVRSGYAWAYRRYVKNQAYLHAENYAKQWKLGIWSEKTVIYPEDYRRSQRKAR